MALKGKVYKRNKRTVTIMAVLLSASVILGVSGVVFYSLNKEISELEKQSTKETEFSILETFSQIEKATSYFSNTILPVDDDDLNYLKYRSIENSANLCMAFNQNITSICVYNDSKKFVFDYGSSGNTKYVSRSCLGSIFETKIYTVNNTQNKVLSFQLEKENNSYISSSVYIDVNSANLSKSILPEDDLIFQLVVDSSGTILLSRNKDDLYKNINTYGIDLSRASKSGYKCNFNGEKRIVSSVKSSDYDFYILRITSEKLYSSYYQSSIIQCLIISVLAVFSATLSLTYIFRVTYKPIDDTVKYINDLLPQNILPVDINESEYIRACLSDMYSSQKDLNEKIVDSINELQQKQILALQTQICPHFLYNTLDSINWMAVDYNGFDNSISKCIGNIAEILDYSMDLTTVFLTISQEIEVSKKYVEILKERFNKQILFEWNVDESLNDYKILKICLQPIIENAASHGFQGRNRTGTISITVRRVEETIEIYVKDDGIGIEPEHLKLIKNNINDKSDNSNYGIGIRNVNLRLKLLYGEKYGLHIESEYKKGTICSITFPCSKF